MIGRSPRWHLFATTAAAATSALVLASWTSQPGAQPTDAGKIGALTESRQESAGVADQLKEIRGQLPGQAHVMMDVAYHFSGVWLAAQHKNWPLVRFYYDETRSHLRWAVRVRPTRKISTGDEISLGNILDSLEAAGGPLEQLKGSIEQKDLKKLRAAYRTTLEACYACHKATEKSYLRPKIPTQMGDVINLDPAAVWPR